MAPPRCRRCGFYPLTNDYAFCPNCGEPTKSGAKTLDKREKIGRILLQLERAAQSGHVSQDRYESQKSKYLNRLAEIEGKLPSNRVAAAPSIASIPPPPPDWPKGDIRGSVMYANPPRVPWYKIVWYLAASIVLVFLSIFLVWNFIGEGFETVWLDKWYLFAFSLTGPAIYMRWMYRNDKFEREPVYFVALILGWGAFAAFLSFLGNGLFDAVGLGYPWLSAPLVEESTKAVGVYFMAKSPEFNDSMDGMVYGFAAGTGFAWIENFFYIVYVYEGNLIAGLLRVFVFGLGHGLYTAFMGMRLGEAKVKRGHVKRSDIIPALIPAMLAHGWYNSYLIGIFDLPALPSLIIWLLATHGLLTLVLIYYVRRAWRQERLWLYDRGLAPTG